jgi:hypothetical protein
MASWCRVLDALSLVAVTDAYFSVASEPSVQPQIGPWYLIDVDIGTNVYFWVSAPGYTQLWFNTGPTVVSTWWDAKLKRLPPPPPPPPPPPSSGGGGGWT